MRDVLFRRKNWLGVERLDIECTFKTIVLNKRDLRRRKDIKNAHESYFVHHQENICRRRETTKNVTTFSFSIEFYVIQQIKYICIPAF